MRSLVIVLGLLLISVAYMHGYTEGHEKAKKTALSTNPVSEELEMVCAGLWIGEQNKKYWNKGNASKPK